MGEKFKGEPVGKLGKRKLDDRGHEYEASQVGQKLVSRN